MDNNNPGQVTNFIQTFTNKIEQLNGLNARLRERVARDTAFYPNVTEKLQQINAMVQAIENKLKTAKNRISILLDNTDIASGELLQATKEGQTLAQLLQQNFQQRREHKEIIADLRAQMTDLTVRINTLTRDLDLCHEMAGNSETELNNCRSELMNTRKQLENCKSQLALNEMMLKDCERQKETLQSDLTDAQQQLSTGSQKQQELATEIQGHLRDIEQNEKERDELQRQQTALQGERDNLDAANRDLQGRHTTLQGDRDALGAANRDLQERFNALDERHKALITEHNGLIRTLAELRTQHDATEAQNQDLRNQVENLTRERDALQANHTALQGQHDTLQEQHGALQEQHGALQGQHSNLEAQNQELQGQIANLTMEHNALQANRNELQGQHEALQGQHEALQGQHEALQVQHANVNNDIQALRAQRDQLIAAIDNASRVIDETIGQISAILNTGENSEDITRSLEELLRRLTVMSNDNIGEFEAQPGLPPRPPGPPRPNQGTQPIPFLERFRNRSANPPTLSDLGLSRTEPQTPTNRPSAFAIAPPSGQNTGAPVNPIIQRRGRGLGAHFVARRNPPQTATQNADTQNLYGSLTNEPTRFNTDNPMISPPSSPRTGGKKRKNTKKAKRANKKNKITKKRIKQTAGFLYNKHLVNPFQKRTTRRNKYTHSSSIKGSPKSSIRYYNRIGSPRTISYRSKPKHARRVKSRRSSISSAY